MAETTELGQRIKVVLKGLPGWRCDTTGGRLCLKNGTGDTELVVKRLPFSKSALSGEMRLKAPTGTFVLNLAIDGDTEDEILRRHFERLFGTEPVLALLDRLIPMIRDFLLLEIPTD
jgi:hypothetical protein